MNRRFTFYLLLMLLIFAGGCTVHPDGEQQERDLARKAGQPYGQTADQPKDVLAANATPDDLVRYAWLDNPELEQRYWEWKSAIEQIPQDGTQATNLVVYANVPITHGSTAFNKTVVTLANDPMADIQWPSKPTTAARRALEQARAAGWRFQQAKLDIRQKVLVAYDELALGAEMIRLEETDAQLLSTTAEVADANVSSGKSTQTAALSAQNEAELSKNRLAELRAKLPALLAALNVALGRDPDSTLSTPAMPAMRDPHEALARAQSLLNRDSPQLAALNADVRSKQNSVQLAKLQYVPDFSLSGSTDLAGITQNLSAMITVPLLKYQAINAAIAQAEANLRASQAMRRQGENDLRSRLLADETMMDDLDRQLRLFDTSIIPRAESIASLGKIEYEAGALPLMDWLQAQRSITALKRLAATMGVSRDERLIDIENMLE